MNEDVSNEGFKLEEKLLGPSLARSYGDSKSRTIASWAQQRLWFIDQLEKGCAAYHISLTMRLFGELDRYALERSLDEMIQRHHALHTVFVNVNGVVEQRITEQSRFEMGLVDLTGFSSPDCEAQVHQQRIAEVQAPFDLELGPLIRGRLLKISNVEHMLLITVHHIVSDGWSLGVFTRELTVVYRAYRENLVSPLQPLNTQYPDYTAWQREWFAGERLEKQLGYWRSQLAGIPPQLELPTDRIRPNRQSYRGENVPVTLDQALTQRLRDFAARRQLTLFMVLYACWSLLMSRLSGQEDVTIGTPVANRQRPEWEGLVGFFVNTLTLRAKIHDGMTIEDFLKDIRDTTLSAYDNQDLPFEKVVEAVQPTRNLARNPLFQVMIMLGNIPNFSLRLPELTVVMEEEIAQYSMFDLHLMLTEQGEEVVGGVHYATDLFDSGTIERWMIYFKSLLLDLVSESKIFVGDLLTLPQKEKRRVVEYFNDTLANYPSDRLLTDLIEQQASYYPDAVAVIHNEKYLTYAKMIESADRVAAHLMVRGVAEEDLVAVCLERGLMMVVGVVGILKAGAAYVPLDSEHPHDRLLFIVKDSAPAAILTQKSLAESALVPILSAHPECIVTLTDNIDCCGKAPPAKENTIRPGVISSRSAAYVIYTSGSTGRPKGVLIEHRSVVNFLKSIQMRVGMELADKVLSGTTLSFDIAGLEIFLPLISGASLVVADHLQASDPAWLSKSIEDEQITLFQATPATWSMLLDSGWLGSKTLSALCGGEVLTIELCKQLWNRVGRLWNVYGPTETTIWSTAQAIDSVENLGQRFSSTPIGQPLANTQIYLLDTRLRPVPVGVRGELYISGDGLARGYLKRPGLTAERFIPNPFCLHGTRMYRTGDLARWTNDGVVEYLGRSDSQIKIRGYRVELGEVESLILENPAVSQVAVMSREDASGDKSLIAYIVTTPDMKNIIASDELRGEIVKEWEILWKDAYSSDDGKFDPSFAGWNSSYTGRPIPQPEMQEWLAAATLRIGALHPHRVLEIGCGVGLILKEVAYHCDAYLGIDVSAQAVGQLRRWAQSTEGLSHVTVLHRSASDLHEFPSASYDLVILNSVIQYFPDIQYLIRTLKEAARLLIPGGKIFVGDVRHFGLLPLFHSAVQLSRAAPSLSLDQLRRRIADAMDQEKELVLDPEFFRTLPDLIPGICDAEISLKRGSAYNELTRYRYDVVLVIGEGKSRRRAVEREDWNLCSVEKFRERLEEKHWSEVRFCGIPNARLAADVTSRNLLESCTPQTDVSSVRFSLSHLKAEGLDPEALCQLAESYGYEAHLRWNDGGALDSFDMEISKSGEINVSSGEVLRSHEGKHDLRLYANDPMTGAAKRKLIPALRQALRNTVPEYMVPSVWVILEKFPLTPNRKIDRKAFPPPPNRSDELGVYVSPTSDLERLLAEIWEEVLRVGRVGANDNFFELGGHSLLGIKVIANVKTKTGLSLPVTSIFLHPTVRELAHYLEANQAETSSCGLFKEMEFEEGSL